MSFIAQSTKQHYLGVSSMNHYQINCKGIEKANAVRIDMYHDFQKFGTESQQEWKKLAIRNLKLNLKFIDKINFYVCFTLYVQNWPMQPQADRKLYTYTEHTHTTHTLTCMTWEFRNCFRVCYTPTVRSAA